MSSLPTLHVLGCGRAAQAIARSLHQVGAVEIGQVCNRSLGSARAAVAFIGSGTPVEFMDQAVTGGWLLLGLADDDLAAGAVGLSHRMPGQPELAFHLSGSTPAAVLEPLAAPVAAVHPVRAFADPQTAAERFSGTWCVAEGQALALERLKPAFEAAGARWLALGAGDKALYHAATVAASNFLVTLTDLARRLAEAGGLAEPQARELIASLQRSTLDNLEQQSTESALTGPVERNDLEACRQQLERLVAALPGDAPAFRAMALATVALAERKDGDERQALRKLFELADQPLE